MNAADPFPCPDGEPLRPAGAPATDLRPDEPMDAERCLFVLSLLMDGRPVPAEVERRARDFAARDERCRAALAELTLLHELLASEPARIAPEGFTERVLAARRVAGADETGAVLPFARRLAAAAALVLALSVGWEVARPGRAVADPRLEVQPHALDAFRPQAFGALDLEAGLEHLLPDPAPAAGGEVGDGDEHGEDARR